MLRINGADWSRPDLWRTYLQLPHAGPCSGPAPHPGLLPPLRAADDRRLKVVPDLDYHLPLEVTRATGSEDMCVVADCCSTYLSPTETMARSLLLKPVPGSADRP